MASSSATIICSARSAISTRASASRSSSRIRAPRMQAGSVEAAFTESIDVMPTIVEWLGGEVPRACDGRSLVPFTRQGKPGRLAHRAALRIRFPRHLLFAAGAGARHRHGSRRACAWCRTSASNTCISPQLPPLLLRSYGPIRISSTISPTIPAYAALVRDYAQKALSWRLVHADRTLTHFRATPKGLEGADHRAREEHHGQDWTPRLSDACRQRRRAAALRHRANGSAPRRHGRRAGAGRRATRSIRSPSNPMSASASSIPMSSFSSDATCRVSSKPCRSSPRAGNASTTRRSKCRCARA